MTRIARVLLMSAVLVAATPFLARPADASCRVMCCTDPDECFCLEIMVEGKPYGPCML